ncbi:unnamed protein product [Darwinula stevensoni]|uniref:Phosphoinositide phospholipase C n=1 Tax=Darwinula stevensoni TaxID=69355 RepID=A0A7R9AC96_9CRUS|nr:unnamed protein product [Darwinula stevensoni]CAG0899970.1 unnamed protein product [Darwinula stevensoni]
MDVLRIIKEHAFAVSDYPVILSIEDHCSLPQQRRMAVAFQEVFGDALLKHRLDPASGVMPSPEILKRKIILKHKKLPESSSLEDTAAAVREDAEGDASNWVKNGVLYLEDPVDRRWNRHFFVLTPSRLYYTVEREDSAGEDDGDDRDRSSIVKESCPNEELHFGEKWFHGRLPGGRANAEKLLREYSHLGDGTFLVRESETFVGDYSLSFWRQGQVNHCRIKNHQESGRTKYYMIDTLTFDSLYDLVTHYRTHPLRSQEFLITLKEPVPQPSQHEGKEWYHSALTRQQAEEFLKRVPYDGAFLVRKSDKEPNTYAISFRAEGKIKHCCIKQEGRLFVIGTSQFESLVDLVEYYEKNDLYKKMKLKYPVNEELVRRLKLEPEEGAVYGHPDLYTDPNSFTSKVVVKAMYDYRAQREDELSFCKHAIISNVNKRDGGWWQGDYGGKKQHYFPANYVQEVESGEENGEGALLGNLQQGSVDIVGCDVEILDFQASPSVSSPRPSSATAPTLNWIVRIKNSTMMQPFDLACPSRAEAVEWGQKINQVSQRANDLVNQHKEMERIKRIAKELSNLVVYCQSVAFCPERIQEARIHTEMSSFPENKIEKWLNPGNVKFLLWYHQIQMSRVYPKGQRLDSSNYDPVRMWNGGCQMVALNFQTPDRAMQLNQGRFLANGGCGYVLRPEFMLSESFDPYNRGTLDEELVPPLSVTIQILAGRHLTRPGKSGRGILSPFVEVEVVGAPYDSGNRYITRTVQDNGFNPVWNEVCSFDIACPALAMIRFVVQDEDMFGEPNFLGQATYPVECMRCGYRSVRLRNGYSESLELASLLVHVEMRHPRSEENEIRTLRDRLTDLKQCIEVGPNPEDVTRSRQEFTDLERRLFALLGDGQNRLQRHQGRLMRRVSSSLVLHLPFPPDIPSEIPAGEREMVKSRLEINFRRLLVRCETLAASSDWKDTWRSQEYLNALTELLAEVKSAPNRVCEMRMKGTHSPFPCSRPDPETLSDYQAKVDYLKRVVAAEKLGTGTVREGGGTGTLGLTAPSSQLQDPLTRDLQHRVTSRVNEDVRRELFGRGEQASLEPRHRKGATATTTDFDALLQFHHKQQEKVAEDMLGLVQSLKEQSLVAGKIILKDNKVLQLLATVALLHSVLEKSSHLAEGNFARLKVESDRLSEYRSRSCKCWVYLLLIIISVTFFGMVMFMRLFKKRVHYGAYAPPQPHPTVTLPPSS